MWWLFADKFDGIHVEAVGGLERLRILREHEMGVRVEDEGGVLYVRPAEK